MFRESWLEADLYWFQGAAASTKAVELFDRLGPLWAREEAARPSRRAGAFHGPVRDV